MIELAKKLKLNEENESFCQVIYDYLKQRMYNQMKNEEKQQELCEKIKFLLKIIKPSI